MKMKRIYAQIVCSLLFALLLLGTASAAEMTAWGSIQEETAILCLPGAKGEQFACQVGNVAAEIISVTPLHELEVPVDTIVLIDNSLSIQKDQRPIIKELLGDLIANRLAGERYTIATISDQVNYLCSGESDYTVLKSLVDNLEFKDQRTQLTDGLYHVLEQWKESDDGTLRRLLIIADGVDNKQVGYTQSELAALIQEIGYPIYTVGCANNSSAATEELQNLFALSRLTSGSSYYLPEVQKTMDIVSGIIAWNDSVQLKVQLPPEICDGMNKVLRVTSDAKGDTYLAELKMPLAEIQETKKEPETKPEPVPVSSPEPDPEEEPEREFPVAILVVVGLAAIAGILLALFLLKKKSRERIEETPDVKPQLGIPADTELLSGPSGTEGETEGIWSSSPSLRLVLQNLDNPSHRVEAVLNGEMLIGRDASVCQIVLTEPSVARRQCRVFQQSGWVMISNLSQSNITKLDGETLTENRELSSGSILQMGRLRMRVDIL